MILCMLYLEVEMVLYDCIRRVRIASRCTSSVALIMMMLLWVLFLCEVYFGVLFLMVVCVVGFL